MSPKLKEFTKRQRERTNPLSSSGLGVGLATDEEKEAFKKSIKIVFKLVNLTSLAQHVKLHDNISPFREGNIVYITYSTGEIIGEAPKRDAAKIIVSLEQGFRFAGYISDMITKKSNVAIEVTLIARQ